MLTSDEVREILDYNPDTGEFRWKKRPDRSAQWNGKFAGKLAGTPHNGGYTRISIEKRFYLSHRLAWLYVYGEWPTGEIDHINQIRSDSRIVNLRDVTRTVNNQNVRLSYKNSKSKCRGVCWHKASDSWLAAIRVGGKTNYLGIFKCKLAAKIVYENARQKLHDGFPVNKNA